MSIIDLDTPFAETIGFTSDRFTAASYLWRVDDAIIVSFIQSQDPCTGSFRELVNAILAMGLTVRVPSPLGRMATIVRKAGYRYRVVDVPDIGAVEYWELKPPVDTGG